MSDKLSAASVARKLPVHGFVLAGGKSSRMGVDKAMLEFRGRPMVQIAVQKLHEFCADVSICGNRDDLSGFAPVVREVRVDCGPAAGIEAGLQAARQDWCLFVPVDVPLMPGELLRGWAEDVLTLNTVNEDGIAGSYLTVNGRDQPAFCVLRAKGAINLTEALDSGERKLGKLVRELRIGGAGYPVARDMKRYVRPTDAPLELCFSNLNTTDDFEVAESWAESLDS